MTCDRCDQPDVVTINGEDICIEHLDEAMRDALAPFHELRTHIWPMDDELLDYESEAGPRSGPQPLWVPSSRPIEDVELPEP